MAFRRRGPPVPRPRPRGASSETSGLPPDFYRVHVAEGLGIPDIGELKMALPGGFSHVFVRPMRWDRHQERPVIRGTYTAILMVRNFHDPQEAPSLVEYNLPDAIAWGLESPVLRLLPANQAELYALGCCRSAVREQHGCRLIAPGAETYDAARCIRVAPMLDLASERGPALEGFGIADVFTGHDRIVYLVDGGEAAMRAADARL